MTQGDLFAAVAELADQPSSSPRMGLALADLDIFGGETRRVRELAEMTVTAELDADTIGEIDEDMVLAHMSEWQRVWRESPGLRSCIRVASKLTEEEASKSGLVRVLWLMSRSDEWRRQPGGKMGIMVGDPFVDAVYERG